MRHHLAVVISSISLHRGALPSQSKTRVGRFLNMLAKESMNPRRLGVYRLLFFAVSPQEQPFDPDPHLLKLYVKRACRVRENFAEMIEFVYQQLEDCCDQADRSAFSLEGKCAVDMTEAEICSSRAQDDWNVTEEATCRIWHLMMNHTNQQIILPPRPPIINFHTEESLWAVSKKKLVKVAKREGVKYTHMRKDGIIANILEHQGGRDMTGRRFVPISVWKFFVEFHKFRLVDTANANPQGRRYLSLSWRPIVVLLVVQGFNIFYALIAPTSSFKT